MNASPEPQPEDTQERMRQFVELVSAAIANADSRAELVASRGCVAAASDATRRRIDAVTRSTVNAWTRSRLWTGY